MGLTGSVHAEVHAIARANRKRLMGSTITVAGIRATTGTLVFARPCAKLCLPRIRVVGISHMVYRNKSGHWVREVV